MATQKLIPVKEFCVHHHIKPALIQEFYNHEMIELVWVKRTGYIPQKSLQPLERMLRLHNELQINIEGIQTILHLLSNIEKKETELQKLRNLLEFYTSA